MLRRASRGSGALVALLAVFGFATSFLQLGAVQNRGAGRREVLSVLAVAPVLSSVPDAAFAKDLSGNYDDPEYPGCKRRIITLNDGEVQVNMKDPDRGRSCKGKQEVKYVLKGSVSGDQVTIDFADRGGGKVVAKFDGKTLSFPDGKAWARVSGLAKKSIKNKAVVGTSMNGLQFVEPED
mmetsp:Transcript_84859/g.173038  ORF Transcript_84859/g.173038 Transcript_84859/m.173038 type:complete len:180 (-) Transcript_84859:9-548(-)